jgi:hypothetical protein
MLRLACKRQDSSCRSLCKAVDLRQGGHKTELGKETDTGDGPGVLKFADFPYRDARQAESSKIFLAHMIVMLLRSPLGIFYRLR